MFQPTARDTMYPITTNKTGYSSTTVLRRNGNAVDIYEKKNRREVNNQILMQAIKLFWMFMKFSWLIDWKGWQSFSQLITFEAHQFYIYEAQVNAPLKKKLCESIFKFSGKDIAIRGRRLLCHSNENINRFKRHHHSKTK